MFPFSASQWDATLSSRCRGDGESLRLPHFARRASKERTLLFTRVITYQLPDHGKAEIEVIIASRKLWGPKSCPEDRGWKTFPVGPGLVLAVRLSMLVSD